MRRKLTYANVVSTVCLFLLLGGTAVAAHQFKITSTGQIKPSVRRSLRGLTGATGPAGAVGPQGAAGPRGLQGEPGSPGLSDYKVVRESDTMTAASYRDSETVTCPAGDRVLGGGGGDFNRAILMTSSTPLETTIGAGYDAWQVNWETVNGGPLAEDSVVYVNAVCAKTQ